MSLPANPHGWYRDLDEHEYHAHAGSLSVSGAKVMLKAPALFKWQREHPVHKDVFDIGSAAHALVLGVGAEIVEVTADSWRSKAAQEAREVARAEGKTALLAADVARVREMADALSSHRLAMRLMSDGEAEVSAFAADPETGVIRRGRFDWLAPVVVIDYKSAASAHPDAFVKAAVNFGYHQQAAWYLDLAADLDHPAQGFGFVVQEKEPPYLTTVVELPDDLVHIGRQLNRVALQRYRDCTESGKWPGYVDDQTIARPLAPRWALNQEIPA